MEVEEEKPWITPKVKKVDEKEEFPPYGELRIIQLESGTAWHVFVIDKTPNHVVLPYLAGTGWTTRLDDKRYWFFAERDKEMEDKLAALRKILANPPGTGAKATSSPSHKFSDLNVSKTWRQPIPGLRFVKYSEKHAAVVGEDLKNYVSEITSNGGVYREGLKFGLGSGFLMPVEKAEQFHSQFE